jgi:4-hydroxybutyrate CoA-transferase
MSDSHVPFITADEAVSTLTSGQRVYIHNGCAEPVELVQALTRRGPGLRDVEVVHMATMGLADYTLPEFEGHFRHNGLFLGANVRRAVQEGRGDYTPVFLSEIEGLFRSNALPVDLCLLQCSPPDEHGYMSLGVSVDVTLAVVSCARRVVVEVNDQMPRTLGETFLHVSRADALVEASHPLVEYPQPRVTDVHRAIGKRVAQLVPDGATIQTGIGGIPEATLGFLGDHKDLGIHSEMIPDGAIDLMERGVINGARKSLHPRRAVAGFVLGTRRLFRYIHENPAFEFLPTGYVNDPFVIAQNDRMVAINSALEVDLTGQVCSDSVGCAPYSGIGGQVDFLRGAARSKGGVPIIALPSTAKNGTISRIVPFLKTGAGVVTSRGDVHYVITEHGTAYLHGKTLRQRVEALIAVADPKFRGDLENYARQERLIDAREPALALG